MNGTTQSLKPWFDDLQEETTNMPTLKVRTEYIEKLQKLGVYDQWLANVKAWHHSDQSLINIHTSTRFSELIASSFGYSGTPEGAAYWMKIGDS